MSLEFYKIPQEHPGYAQLLEMFQANPTPPMSQEMTLRLIAMVEQAFNKNTSGTRKRLQTLVDDQLDSWALLVLTAGYPEKALIHQTRVRRGQAEIALLSYYTAQVSYLNQGTQSVDEVFGLPVDLPDLTIQYVPGQLLSFELPGADGRPASWKMIVTKAFVPLDQWRAFRRSSNQVDPTDFDGTRQQAREFLQRLRDLGFITYPAVPTPVNLLDIMDPRNG